MGCHGVSKQPVFKAPGMSLGGSGVSIGGVRILREGCFLCWVICLFKTTKKNLDLRLFDADGTRYKKLLLPNGGLQKNMVILYHGIESVKNHLKKTDPSSLRWRCLQLINWICSVSVESFSVLVSCTCHEPKQLICSKPQQKAWVLHSPKLTNIAPGRRPGLQKETHLRSPWCFRCELLASGMVDQ